MNFRQDFLSFFQPRFFGNDMREANPTMVLTALQSESQAQRAAFWVKFQMPCVGSTLNPPSIQDARSPNEEYEAFLGSGIFQPKASWICHCYWGGVG